VRLYERYGRDLSGHLEFPARLLNAQEVNGLEESVADTVTDGNKLYVTLQANGIRSYRVALSGQRQGRVIGQSQLALPLNEKLISANGEKGGGIFPAELIPETIKSGPIEYHLASGKEKDALSCNGQYIDISQNHSFLFILAGAVEGCAASMAWLDGTGQELGRSNLDVPAMTGFIGQWDQRIWKKEPRHHLTYRRDYAWINRCIGVQPGYIKRQRLEWYSTHIHADGADQAYRFGYMFTFVLDIPGQAIKILLPKEPQIKIFAMTTLGHGVKVKNSYLLKDKYDF
jgi:alpha-mannosidase